LPPGQPYYEIYPASGPVAFSAKRNPTCINQGTAEHTAREYSRDGRACVIEHAGADGKRTKVAEFRNGRPAVIAAIAVGLTCYG
jgi:hypothetical protein